MEIFAIIKSPTVKSLGFPIVIVLLVAVFVAVAVPRRAICADTSCPSKSPSRIMNVFTIVVSEEKRRRTVSMDDKKLVFSFKLVANLLQLVDKKTIINEILILLYRKEAFLQVH